MSRTGSLWRTWPAAGDRAAEREFRLPIGGLVELEDRTGLAPEALIDKLSPPDAGAEDLDLVNWFADRERVTVACVVLEIALKWGGASKADAKLLVDLGARIAEDVGAVPVAMQVLQAALLAPPDDPFPKYPRKIKTGAEAAAGEADEKALTSAYYRFAGSAGLDPRALADMSVWQYAQYAYGRYMANVPLDENTMTAEEEAALRAAVLGTTE